MLANKFASTPLLPTNKHNQEHNTVGTHFILFEMGLGLAQPFAVSNKYIHRGARYERTNPNDNTTPFLWMSPNSRAARTRRQVLPHSLLTPGGWGERVIWGPGQPQPTHPPTHMRNPHQKKMKFIKAAGNLRSIFWPLTHAPAAGGRAFCPLSYGLIRNQRLTVSQRFNANYQSGVVHFY